MDGPLACHASGIALCFNAHAPAVGAKNATMKHTIVFAALALSASLSFAKGPAPATAAAAPASAAASAAKTPTTQQQLMGTCNTEATGKKGDERKAFMKSCLSDGRKQQQERMKSCNVDAAGKKGDERKAFMSDCLKK